MPLPIPVDLSTAAVRRLRAFPAFQNFVLVGLPYVGAPNDLVYLIGTDATDGLPNEEKVNRAWLFQGLDDEGRPFRDPEGSGSGVVVLSERREWASPNRHNTAQFPELQILVYMDSTRNAEGAVLEQDAASKAKFVMDTINDCFHLVGNQQWRWDGATEDWLPGADQWPGLTVHSSVRSSARSIQDVPGTQSNTVRGEMRYEMTTD